jgi:mono/diheme cytochrome c family protein
MNVRKYALLALAVLVAIQLVPYGRAHSNPPVQAEPPWDSEATRTLFFQACGDCHSNETVWPWYSAVAPVSWLVQHDVDEGREHLNVSEWGRERQDGDEAAEMVRDEEMPPWFYLPLHPEARLTADEIEGFLAGLEATFGASDPDHDHDHDDH